MTEERTGWQKPRPLRFAFLVEETQYHEWVLDGIFADCYNRWGGRFSLIVPCVDGQIVPSFWPWLEAYDPDIIYSYVALERDRVLELHERIYPAEYLFHRKYGEPRLDAFGFKPDYRFQALSSLSGVFTQARFIEAPTKQLQILDCWYGSPGSRFITDNFGTYHASTATGMFPADAQPYARLVTIVPPDKAASRKHGIDPAMMTLPDELSGFRSVAEGQTSCMAAASIWRAPRQEIRHDRWSTSFNLVVGDTFADRIMFWNARLLIPAWLDPDFCCLRITEEQIADPAFMDVLKTFLQRRNHVNAGSGGQSSLTVRSISLSAEALRAATEAIRSLKPWSAVLSERVDTLAETVPDDRAFEYAREIGELASSIPNRPSWYSFQWQGDTARPPAISPSHLADAPPRQHFTTGLWANDFILEQGSGATRRGSTNTWQLPLRWRMARAFEAKRANDSHSRLPPARRSRGGRLSLVASTSSSIETIHIPDVRQSFDFALGRDGAWAKPDGSHGDAYPPARIYWSSSSNEDAYLTGVIGIAGGLQNAMEFLLHPFLRAQFAKLGATPDAKDHDQTALLNKLAKRAPRGPIDLNDAGQREYLADLIAREARQLRSPLTHLQYQELSTAWEAYRKAFWASNKSDPDPDDAMDYDAREAASLDRCLQALRRRKMLFQGHQWICQRCAHRNWADLAAMAPEMPCEVCRSVTQAPVDIKWLFRPNEFLVQSLRDHSVLSLLWVISELSSRARDSFVFAGPTSFGFEPASEDPDAEADVLALVDGACYLVEVKNSWRSCGPNDIKDLVEDAKRLRPDVALFAVMAGGQKRKEEIEKATSDLQALGIRFELLTTDTTREDDSPYLPSDH